MSDRENAWWFTGKKKPCKIFEQENYIDMPVLGRINRSEGESKDRLKAERLVRKLLKYIEKNRES